MILLTLAICQIYGFALPVKLSWASSRIYDFACLDKQSHWFCVHWRTSKFKNSLARANEIMDAACIGKLPNQASKIMHFTFPGKLQNLWFWLPGQVKSWILFAVASESGVGCGCQIFANQKNFMQLRGLRSVGGACHKNHCQSCESDAFACPWGLGAKGVWTRIIENRWI